VIRLWAVLLMLFLPGLHAQDESDPSRDLARARMEEREVLTSLSDLDKELAGVEQDLSELRKRGDELSQQRVASEDDLAATQASMDRLRQVVADHCKALYRLNRRGIARIIFSADDPADLRRRTRYLLAILKSDRTRFRKFMDQVQRKEAALARVESDRASLGALQAEVRLRESTVRDARARKLGLLQEVRERRSLAMRALAQRDQSIQSLGSYDAPPPVRTSAPAKPMATLKGKLPCPITGTLMRGFGTYTDPNTGTKVKNGGVDISVPYGTPVRSVADGYVATTRHLNGFGFTVVVDHGGNHTTIYTHLARIQVKPGQHLKAGDQIGPAGETGVLADSLGPRLHLEVKYHGTSQNPLSWLKPGCVRSN
jgi:septal ring factor EnvC (AmiA/AmiB activator)